MKMGYAQGFGKLWEIRVNDNKLIGIYLTNQILKEDNDDYVSNCKKQLQEYFSGVRKSFSLQYELTGTDFQKQVWNALQTIPYGETRSYLEIAQQIGRPKSVRAVGQAVGSNPLAIVLPCHRVIGSSGKLVGYAYGLSLKERLLEFEKNRFIEDSRSRKTN